MVIYFMVLKNNIIIKWWDGSTLNTTHHNILHASMRLQLTLTSPLHLNYLKPCFKPKFGSYHMLKWLHGMRDPPPCHHLPIKYLILTFLNILTKCIMSTFSIKMLFWSSFSQILPYGVLRLIEWWWKWPLGWRRCSGLENEPNHAENGLRITHLLHFENFHLKH